MLAKWCISQRNRVWFRRGTAPYLQLEQTAHALHEGEKHHNERLIRKALESYPDQSAAQRVVVATKGICVRPARVSRAPSASPA